jgi:uncharacterized membrane protein
METPDHTRNAKRLWLGLASLPILLLALWLGGREDGLAGVAHYVGYAVCHQITVRTYVFGDLVMPLCARCSGQYLGVLIGFFLAWRWGRIRAMGLPPRRLVAVLVGFLAIWAFDGFNSYLYLILGHPFLYQPQNIFRISTGILQGLAVSFLFLPFFNQAFWAEPAPDRVLQNGRELAQALGLGALVVLAVVSGWPPLFYPLAFLSVAATVLMLSLVGTLFVLLALREENSNRTLGDFFSLFLPGMAFAALLLLAIDLFRAYAESALGMVLPTG